MLGTPNNRRLPIQPCARDIEVIFPIKDDASAALILIKADCLHKAGIINGAEQQYVYSKARTFLDDAPLEDAACVVRDTVQIADSAGATGAFRHRR